VILRTCTRLLRLRPIPLIVYKAAATIPPNSARAGYNGAAVAMAMPDEPEIIVALEAPLLEADPPVVVERPVPVVDPPPDLVAAVAEPTDR
jgi:hypothetical protein